MQRMAAQRSHINLIERTKTKMTRYHTLEEVKTAVHEMSSGYWDAPVTKYDMEFEGLDQVWIDGTKYDLQPIAKRGIAIRLGIPYPYLAKCPSHIQTENLNYWISREHNNELFVRFEHQEVRAIFTPRYKPCDNKDIIEKLEQMGTNLETPVECRLDPEFMMLNIPDEEKTFSIQKGDRFQPGFSIVNSEVGLSALSISAYTVRLICTNGLISTGSVTVSHRHVSDRIADNIPDIVQNVSKNLDYQKRLWKLSLESPVDHVQNTFDSFNARFNLNEDEREAVNWAWIKEQGQTMFNIINTYTKASQSPHISAESSHRLQKTGGSILSLLN
jgi:hypothetical protein